MTKPLKLRVFAAIWISFTAGSFATGNEKLAFHTDPSGDLIFNTGVVKGNLQKEGKGEGIKPIQFVGDGASFVINHGLLCPYRFLTPQKRYGFGSWEWQRTGKILADGGAELSWSSDKDRPFHFSQSYRWKSEDTLDVTINFTSETNLEKFELLLGSYLTNSTFNKTKVYVKDDGKGQPGFIEAANEGGATQLYPRNSAALSVVNDGRWKFPPFPMDWRIHCALAAPLGVKRDAKSGATVVFMSPPEDCFALPMWQQGAKQGGFYMSMFGRNIASGQKAIAHVRLVFRKNISDLEILSRYVAYLEEIKPDIDPAAARLYATEAVAKPDWISPEIPKPNTGGWIPLFDGKNLYGCDPKDPIFTSVKAFLKDGSLQADNARIHFSGKAQNATLRVRGKKISGRNITLSIGPYRGWFNGQYVCFGIHKTRNEQILKELAVNKAPHIPDFCDMEMSVINGKITLKTNGTPVLTAQAEPIDGDASLSVWAVGGVSAFKKIEAKAPLEQLNSRAQ